MNRCQWCSDAIRTYFVSQFTIDFQKLLFFELCTSIPTRTQIFRFLLEDFSLFSTIPWFHFVYWIRKYITRIILNIELRRKCLNLFCFDVCSRSQLHGELLTFVGGLKGSHAKLRSKTLRDRLYGDSRTQLQDTQYEKNVPLLFK